MRSMLTRAMGSGSAAGLFVATAKLTTAATREIVRYIRHLLVARRGGSLGVGRSQAGAWERDCIPLTYSQLTTDSFRISLIHTFFHNLAVGQRLQEGAAV